MLFPNPTSKTLNVRFEGNSEQTNYSFEIYSADGITVMEGNSGASQFTISITALANGLYYLRLADDLEIFSKKFIKE